MNIFACFRKSNVEPDRRYNKVQSSVLSEANCVDMYGRGSIAIRERSGSQLGYEPRENEEIRINAFGPISEQLNSATLPASLSKKSRKVARIGLGLNHAVFLFLGSEVAVSGKNDKGQLGLPISDKEAKNNYQGLTLVTYKTFEEKKLKIIDVAAGTNHTMFLTEPLDQNVDHEGETRKVFVCGDRNMIGRFTTKDADKPKEVYLERFALDPDLRIKFIYSSNEKCIVMDNQNGMTIWGRNFEGKLLTYLNFSANLTIHEIF